MTAKVLRHTREMEGAHKGRATETSGCCDSCSGGGAFRLMCHLLSSIGSTRGWTRYKRWRGICGRDGARRYAVASARELDGALGDNGDGDGNGDGLLFSALSISFSRAIS